MFLFSPRFDWSFSNLPRFNWGCWTLPKCSYFTQMFLILPKIWMKFLVCPNLMKAAGITTWFQFTQGQCLFCHQGQKRPANSLRLFCRWFGYSFALVWKIDDASHTCEGSCTLYPNFENFCPTNSQFFSIGDATASPCLHYDDMNWLPFSLSPTTSHTRSCAELTPRRVINYPLFDAIHGKNQTSQKSNPCVCPKFPINTIL